MHWYGLCLRILRILRRRPIRWGYYFKLREDVNYRIEASVAKENIPYQRHAAPRQRLLYYETDTTFNTYQTKDDTDWNIDLPMRLVPTEEIRLSDIMYDYDKATLRPVSLTALDSLINLLNKSPNISIAIHSHTDSRGSMHITKPCPRDEPSLSSII